MDMRGRHLLAPSTVTRGIGLTACALRRGHPRDALECIGLDYDAIKKEGNTIPEELPDAYDCRTVDRFSSNMQRERPCCKKTRTVNITFNDENEFNKNQCNSSKHTRNAGLNRIL